MQRFLKQPEQFLWSVMKTEHPIYLQGDNNSNNTVYVDA